MKPATHAPDRPFEWPPSPLPTPIDPPPIAPSQRTPALPLLVRLERAWLDPVLEPIERRIEALAWSADELEAFCDRCGAGVGTGEASEFGCAECRGRRFPWRRFVRLGAYDPPLSAWVREIKFAASRDAAGALGRRLGIRLREAGACDRARVAIVPVGMPRLRRMSRGIDHARAIASAAAGELGCPLRAALRRRGGPSQRAVPLSGRAANVRRVFRARWKRSWGAPDLVVLVDDVSTSGATLRAATRTLRRAAPAGTEVWVGALARAEDPGRRAVGGGDGR